MRIGRYDSVRAIFSSVPEMEAEAALRRWGDWVFSAMLPCEVRALYYNLFQKSAGRIDSKVTFQCLFEFGLPCETCILTHA